MENNKETENQVQAANRVLGCLLWPFNHAFKRLVAFICFVALLTLSKGLEQDITVIVDRDIPMEKKVEQMQLIWPDFLGDHRVPALFKLIFGRDRDPTVTPTETPTATFAPVIASPPPIIITATPVPASATPTVITATPLTPTQTPIIITATSMTVTATRERSPTREVATVAPTVPPSDRPTVTPTIERTIAPACPMAPPPQLKPGQSALQLGPSSLRLRQTPGLAGEDVNVRIMRGDRVEVQSEPRCVDGFFWYEVRTARNDIGWTVESGKETRTYYLAPLLTPRKACERKPRLIPGDTARAKTTLKVRQAPRLEAPDIGLRIRKNDRVKVLAGPVCADAYIWYQVRNSRTGDTGWAVAGSEEGVHGDYWFYPPERD